MRPTISPRLPEPFRSGKIVEYGVLAVLLVLVPCLIAFGIELMVRGSWHATVTWMNDYKELFALNALIVFCIFALIYSLAGSFVIGTSVSVLLLGLVSLVSYFKVRLIGEPFFPWDILLNKESFNIIPLVANSSALIRIGILLVAVVGIFALRWLVPRLSLPVYGRVLLGLLSIYALYAMGVKTPLAGKLLNKAGVSEITWNQKENYANNGLSLAFTLNVKNSIVDKPPGYGQPAMATIASQLQESGAQQSAAQGMALNGKKPNVIFIMNEAFWDPTLLMNVRFSEDPLPTIHRLQKESTWGYLISPQFGGGTSNVEFEVLTGKSMSFLPGGSIPYQQYVKRPTASLASYFENLGYKSMGIHSYDGWFWDRQTVYRELGFESFKSKEHFVNPEIKGHYISDDEVSRSIIEEVETSDRPMFIYAVTMQNHGPYNDTRYGTNEIKTEGPLSPEAQLILETYTQGARDADQSLKLLIDHFKQSDEPTIIVFYGDHLPMLGYDYQVYAEAGFVSTGDATKWSLEEVKKMHSIPFAAWSNFALPKQHIPALSHSFLGAHVLDALGLEKPAMFAQNAALSQKVPVLLNNLIIDANQNMYKNVPEELAQDIEQYRELQYDLLFGEKYLADYVDHDYLHKQALSNYNEQFQTQEAE